MNEAATVARINVAVARYNAATREPPRAPVIREHSIDPQLQTGASRGLGGAMEIRQEDQMEGPIPSDQE